jgi:hypothetical protein
MISLYLKDPNNLKIMEKIMDEFIDETEGLLKGGPHSDRILGL